MTKPTKKKPAKKKTTTKGKDIRPFGGRPPQYETPEDLQAAIDKYITTDVDKPTISGLCYHLGFASRQSFYDYENKEGFAYTIKKARLYIEKSYEKKLYGNNVAGPIFALKNLGWKDKQEHGFTDTDGKDLKWAVEIVKANQTMED